jgi:ABC-type transport system substrate-binding protein
MQNVHKKRILAMVFLASMTFMLASPLFVDAQTTLPGSFYTGPFMDKLVIKVIEGDDQQVLALLNEEVECLGEFLNTDYLPEVEADDDVDIFQATRNGFGHITINCGKYPMNYTAFRRAMAFAIDKYAISNEILDGFSYPMDSPCPRPNPYSIEDELEYHYYESQPEIGNATLEAAGFVDTDGDGWREGPNGPFDPIVVFGHGGSPVAMGVAQEGARALRSMGIHAEAQGTDFYEYIENLNNHLMEWDMIFFAYEWTSFLIHNFFAYNFGGDYVDDYGLNPQNWVNETYDALIPDLLYSTDYDKIVETYAAMQEILVYESPMIVAYNNIYLSPFRTNKWEGYIMDTSFYATGPWTHRKVHLKESEGGPYGGTFRQCGSLEPDSFNTMITDSAYSEDIIREMYAQLYTFNEKSEPIPEIAYEYTSETHADNPEVPEGNTRFTFHLYQNATWADGEPLTAEDFAFTYNYFLESYEFGNPSATPILDMTAAYAPTPYTLVIEFSTESFWHFYDVAFTDAYPKHAWLEAGVDPEDWQAWDPVFGDEEENPQLESGAFVMGQHVPGEFTELLSNEHYIFYADRPEETTTTTSEETTTTTADYTMAIVAGAVGAAVVILVGGYLVMRQK